MANEEVDPETGYPRQLLQQATDRWNAMTTDEQDEYRASVRQQMEEDS